MTRRLSTTIISTRELDDMLANLIREEPLSTGPTELDLVQQLEIRQLLESLPPNDRELIELLSGYRIPRDYNSIIPPTAESVGWYIGTKERGRALSGRAIRKRCAAIRAHARLRWRSDDNG